MTAPTAPSRHNILPTAPDSNLYDTGPEDDLEKLQYHDFAGNVVELSRALRDATYATGASDNTVDHLFDADLNGRAGAAELLQFADRLRANRRGQDDWHPYETQFFDHMGLQVDLENARATVDFDALRTRAGATSPEEAEIENVHDIRLQLNARRRAATNPDEVDELARQMRVLRDYLKYLQDPTRSQEDRRGGEGTIENEFLMAHYEAENTTGPRATQANRLAGGLSRDLSAFDRDTTTRIQAFAIISEQPEYHQDPAQGPQRPLPPELEFVKAERPYHETKEIQELREEMEDIELIALRKEMAAHEAGGFNKRVRDWFDNNKGMNVKSYAEIKELYEAARDKKIRREYGQIFEDPAVDPKMKRFVHAKALAKEWEAKRNDDNEVLQGTPVAKIGKWIMKHKLIVVGASALLAPLTLGTSVGIGLAAAGAAVAGAKIDEKTRGMRSINVDATTQDLYRYMRDGNDYDAAVQYMDRLSRKDRNFEKWARGLSVGIGSGAVFGTGLNYFGLMSSTGNFLYSAPPDVVKGGILAAILGSMVRNKTKK